jgi:hypothetical protein
MLPEHYLYILLGSMPGAILGFIASSMLSARKFRRISAEEWLAARKYYQWSNEHRHQ